jgi:hypothetical protein
MTSTARGPLASYVTGQTLLVDGGVACKFPDPPPSI